MEGEWTAPVELAREPNIPTFNPALFFSADKTLRMYYKFRPSSSQRARARSSRDAGPNLAARGIPACGSHKANQEQAADASERHHRQPNIGGKLSGLDFLGAAKRRQRQDLVSMFVVITGTPDTNEPAGSKTLPEKAPRVSLARAAMPHKSRNVAMRSHNCSSVQMWISSFTLDRPCAFAAHEPISKNISPSCLLGHCSSPGKKRKTSQHRAAAGWRYGL